MANVKVSLLRYVRTSKGWRRCRVEEESTRSGRGWTTDWDNPISYGPDCQALGDYQIKWYEGSLAKYACAGRDLKEAVSLQNQKVLRLKAEDAAEEAGVLLVPDSPDRKDLKVEGARYVHDKELADMNRGTILAAKQIIAEFIQVTGLKYADQISQTDMLTFCDALRKRGLSERTVMNYYRTIAYFLGDCGLDHKKIVTNKKLRPNVQDPPPVCYSKEEYKTFIDSITNERHKLFFRFLLMTGCREKEASHLEWNDIDKDWMGITIKGEKILNVVGQGGKERVIKFRTKTGNGRSIPLVSGLAKELQAWRKKNPATRFIFGTPLRDIPDFHLLGVCKNYAFKAGLNCGMCDLCRKSKNRNCEGWFLHKFRASYATWSLRAGTDIKTVSKLLGHSGPSAILMTSRYLAAETGKAAQDRVNAVFGEL